MLTFKEFISQINEAKPINSYHYFHLTHPESGKSLNLSGMDKINRKQVIGYQEKGRIGLYGSDHQTLTKLLQDHLSKKGISATISYKGSNPYS